MGLKKGQVNFVKMLTDDGAVGWWWLMLVLLDHVCLPWHCSDNRVVVVFQVFPLLFALVFLFPGLCCSSYSQVFTLRRSPDISWLMPLPVYHHILDSRISRPHQVVPANGTKHNGRSYIWLKVYGSEQTTKLIG